MDKNINASDWSHIIMVVGEELPEFKEMVESEETDNVMMHHNAFGTELGEITLLGVAVTYATRMGKKVTVV